LDSVKFSLGEAIDLGFVNEPVARRGLPTRRDSLCAYICTRHAVTCVYAPFTCTYIYRHTHTNEYTARSRVSSSEHFRDLSGAL